MTAAQCDAYVMHGDGVSTIARQIADMKVRLNAIGGKSISRGLAAYSLVREGDAEGKRELDLITQILHQPPKGFGNFDHGLSGTRLKREIKL